MSILNRSAIEQISLWTKLKAWAPVHGKEIHSPKNQSLQKDENIFNIEA